MTASVLCLAPAFNTQAQTASGNNIQYPKLSCLPGTIQQCGYLAPDDVSGPNFVIPPVFQNAGKFQDGLAPVMLNGKWGYIDTSGQFRVQPQFDGAGAFDQGLAIFKQDNLAGVINASGRVVLEPQLFNAVVLSDKVLIAQQNPRGFIQGQGVHPTLSSEFFSLSHMTQAGLYHIEKGWLTEPKYTFHLFDKINRQFIWAQIDQGGPGTWDDPYGLMRLDGSWHIEPVLSFGGELHRDRAEVRKMINGQSLSGAINGQGQLVIPFNFDHLRPWQDGFMLARKGDPQTAKYGIVSPDGVLLAGRYFDEIESQLSITTPDYGPEIPQRDFFAVRIGNEWKSLMKDGRLVDDRRIGEVYLSCDGFEILRSGAGYEVHPRDKSIAVTKADNLMRQYTNQK